MSADTAQDGLVTLAVLRSRYWVQGIQAGPRRAPIDELVGGLRMGRADAWERCNPSTQHYRGEAALGSVWIEVWTLYGNRWACDSSTKPKAPAVADWELYSELACLGYQDIPLPRDVYM